MWVLLKVAVRDRDARCSLSADAWLVVGGWWLVVGDGGGDGCEQDVVPDQIDDGLDRERDGGYISVALFSTHPTSSGNVTPHTQAKCMTHGSRACRTRGVSSSACVHGGVKQCVCVCVRACDTTH